VTGKAADVELGCVRWFPLRSALARELLYRRYFSHRRTLSAGAVSGRSLAAGRSQRRRHGGDDGAVVVPQSRQERPRNLFVEVKETKAADESRQAEIDESQNRARRESGLARYDMKKRPS